MVLSRNSLCDLIEHSSIYVLDTIIWALPELSFQLIEHKKNQGLVFNIHKLISQHCIGLILYQNQGIIPMKYFDESLLKNNCFVAQWIIDNYKDNFRRLKIPRLIIDKVTQLGYDKILKVLLNSFPGFELSNVDIYNCIISQRKEMVDVLNNYKYTIPKRTKYHLLMQMFEDNDGYEFLKFILTPQDALDKNILLIMCFFL